MRPIALFVVGLILLALAGCGSQPPAAKPAVKAKVEQPQGAPTPAPASSNAKSPAKKAPAGPATVKLPVRGPGIHEESVDLPKGGKLLYTISVPEGFQPGAPLVLALHYGGEVTPHYGRGLIEGLVGPGLAPLKAVIVAPDARDGEDWTAAGNEQAAVWLTRCVAESYGTDPKRTAVTGFSMGGVGTWHIGSRHPQLFTAAIPVAGRPAGKKDWGIPLYVIHAPADEVFPIAEVRSYVQGLKANGAQVEFVEVPKLTHYDTPKYAAPLGKAAEWLAAKWK